jgi:hypothetical protein
VAATILRLDVGGSFVAVRGKRSVWNRESNVANGR